MAKRYTSYTDRELDEEVPVRWELVKQEEFLFTEAKANRKTYQAAYHDRRTRSFWKAYFGLRDEKGYRLLALAGCTCRAKLHFKWYNETPTVLECPKCGKRAWWRSLCKSDT